MINSLLCKDSRLPLVSVGCAVFNGAETLRRALNSVVKQDYPHLEIIICDDGSTDGSRKICREYAEQHKNIYYVENEENIGLTKNFNKLFNLAKGKYFFLADQDDMREPSFVSKCVAIMESDDDVVLCHSYTGSVWKHNNQLICIVTIDSIDNESSVLKRYWRFLRRFSDTTIYGLIRSESLRRTALWRDCIGSANALLFELLLIGKFQQIPEILYYYYGMGFKKRTTPDEDYERANPGKTMPWYLKPFLVVAFNQTKDIINSACGPLSKFLLLMMVWSNVVVVNATKALYRMLYSVFGSQIPKWLESFCSFIVYDMRDIKLKVNLADFRDCFPSGRLLLKRKDWKFD